MSAPVLALDDLWLRFRRPDGTMAATDAVHGVSFAVGRGRTLAIVGESGSGKSTVALAALRLLPHGAQSGGRALFRPGADAEPVDLMKLAPDGAAIRAVRGAQIGMIFQEPSAAFSPFWTAGHQAAETLRAHGLSDRTEARDRVQEMFARAGIPNPRAALDLYPWELSGGLRQRAMIAAALVARPALLIADEPTTALDVTTEAQVLSLLERLKADLGLSLMLITHDFGVVARLADDVVVMHRGRVVEAGPRDAVLRTPRHDYTKALIAAAPALTPKRTHAPVANEGPALLTVRGLTKRFARRRAGGDGITAVAGVDLTLARGETLAVIGESGSGKTTLARMIARAITPDEGTVHFDGRAVQGDVHELGAPQRAQFRRAVQYVFQDPFHSLNPRMRAGETIAEPLAIHRIGDRASRAERARALLALVGLPGEAAGRYPHAFSGGQRQRIGIARALALEPELLILDEPVSALDLTVQAQILDLLRRLRAELDLTYLMISHDLAVVSAFADRVAVMKDGQIVEEGPVSRLLSAPDHAYTRTLLDAARQKALEEAA